MAEHPPARLRPRGPRGDQGTATAELAVALPAVTLVLAAVLSVGQVVLAQVRCTDAAGAAARSVARGDGAAVARGLALGAVPGARVSVGSGGGVVSVTVTRRVPLLLPGGPEVSVVGRAAAQAETGSAGGDGGDRGSATVLVLTVCLVAVLLSTAVASVGAAVVARHRAQVAADLGALAGADVTLGRVPGEPCARAGAVVRAGGAQLTRCSVVGTDVLIGTSVGTSAGASLLGPAVASARAGAPA
ncbi:MAG TPA: Rv3654c family TadE-like protein [Actinomycetales bacterium]